MIQISFNQDIRGECGHGGGDVEGVYQNLKEVQYCSCLRRSQRMRSKCLTCWLKLLKTIVRQQSLLMKA